nr:hypothetical protein [Tanacetum cinerariifolium]
MMSFLPAIIKSCSLTTNNQLWNSSNRKQQAIINDRRVALQPVQGRQIYFAMGTTRTYTPRASRRNSRKQRIVICYNCKGEGHMSKQCTKPKRKKDDLWFKDKVLLVQAQANGQILHEEELSFFTDLRITEGQATQTVHNPHNVDNNMINQSMQVMSSSEQLNVMNHSKTEITSDSNIIPYSLYVAESQQEAVQNYNSSTQQDAMILSVIEQLKIQLEPKLCDGNVIKSTSAIVIPDSKETLMLAEESHSKMILKQQDLTVFEKKVKTTPVDYANSMNFSDPSPSCRPIKFEVPKELPKVSMDKVKKEHLKHTYKKLYDSIKPTRIRSKEQCDALINQVHQKYVEIYDLNVSLQEKDLVITTLKDELRKLKGKDLADNAVTPHTIALEMLKFDVEPLAPRMLNNRTAHSDYLRLTQEQAAILREVVEQGKS